MSNSSTLLCILLQEQLESAQREIAMRHERERQLQGKLLKAKEELKLEREEVQYKINAFRYRSTTIARLYQLTLFCNHCSGLGCLKGGVC